MVSHSASATASLEAGPTVVTSSLPRSIRCTVVSSLPKVRSVPTWLTTCRSLPLRANFARAWSMTLPWASPVSAAKLTTSGHPAAAGVACRDQCADDVGVLDELEPSGRRRGRTS